MGLTEDSRISWVNPHDLKEHPKNNNMHTPEQIELLAHSIRLNGETRPIVVSTLSGYIVAGHCQLAASLFLGKEAVPVVYMAFANEDEEYFFMTADNEVARKSKSDYNAIKFEFSMKGWGESEAQRMGLDVKAFEDPDDMNQERKKRHCPHCGGEL